MRVIRGLICLMVLAAPAAASAQSFELLGSAGPTLTDTGNSFAVGAGFSPTSRITFLVNAERTHLVSRTKQYDGGFSNFRGGTLLLGTAELRITPFPRARIAPYGLAGFAAGLSRPNVTAAFPTRVTNDVRAVFAGGGIEVPLGDRLAVFADARMMLGSEGTEGMVAVAPVRAGVAFRF